MAHGTSAQAKNNGGENTIISIPTIEDAIRTVTDELKANSYKGRLPQPLHTSSNVVDGIQCFTNYEPHTKRNMGLQDIIASGLKPNVPDTRQVGWLSQNFDALINSETVRTAKLKGYLDIKNIVYGNAESGVLTLKITVLQKGKLFFCEAPGVWGKLPPDFAHLWDSDVDAQFISLATTSSKSLFSSKGKAKPQKMKFVKAENTDSNICVVSTDFLNTGDYNVFISSKTSKFIMIGNVLVP